MHPIKLESVGRMVDNRVLRLLRVRGNVQDTLEVEHRFGPAAQLRAVRCLFTRTCQFVASCTPSGSSRRVLMSIGRGIVSA